MTEIAIIGGVCKLMYGSSRAMKILASFIIYDIGLRDPRYIIDWINNEEYQSAILNYSYIAKHDSKIKIYFFYDGYERRESEERDCFITDKETLIKIITGWEDGQKKPTAITIITKENEKVELTFKLWKRD